MKKLTFLIAIILLTTIQFSQAQSIRTPAPSPSGKITQEVGLMKVEIDYSRPSSKGRKVFGALVPYGEMWRTGANGSTKINFTDDIKVNEIAVPKGTYALYTIPGVKEWTVIIYKNTSFGGVPGDKFKEEEVAARFLVSSSPIAEKVETFTMGVSNIHNKGANIDIMWENTKVSFPFTLETDAKVMADIKSVMEGPSGDAYYAAARYYYDEKKDLKQALEWINKSIEKTGERFWVLRQKALIQAELGMYKDAIKTAERSSELAKTANNNDYQRMNGESIANWAKMKM